MTNQTCNNCKFFLSDSAFGEYHGLCRYARPSVSEALIAKAINDGLSKGEALLYASVLPVTDTADTCNDYQTNDGDSVSLQSEMPWVREVQS